MACSLNNGDSHHQSTRNFSFIRAGCADRTVHRSASTQDQKPSTGSGMSPLLPVVRTRTGVHGPEQRAEKSFVLCLRRRSRLKAALILRHLSSRTDPIPGETPFHVECKAHAPTRRTTRGDGTPAAGYFNRQETIAVPGCLVPELVLRHEMEERLGRFSGIFREQKEERRDFSAMRGRQVRRTLLG